MRIIYFYTVFEDVIPGREKISPFLPDIKGYKLKNWKLL